MIEQLENVAPVEFSSSVASSTSSEESSTDESENSDTASCHVSIPRPVKPILLSGKDPLPDCFHSKRFAIFRHMPKSTKSLINVLKRILKGLLEHHLQGPGTGICILRYGRRWVSFG